ncbi:MAG: hypothetical protein DDT41_01769 [candidate division WS2 bacterium]|nr:hypothetical protein [Candidatus Psychracetigena formicireducens]
MKSRRRTVGVILTLIGVVSLLIWVSVYNSFEESYQRKVEENYQSISDARDILDYAFLGIVPPLPEIALEAFRKCPSVLEVAVMFPTTIFGLGLIPRGYPTQIIPMQIDVFAPAVTPDFLRVANIEVVEGRFLTWEDVEKKRMVCVLEIHPSNPYWFGQEMKIGDYLYIDHDLNQEGKLTEWSLEIVGLVKTHTVHEMGRRGGGHPLPQAYYPFTVALEAYREEMGPGTPYLVYYFRVLDNLKAAKEIKETTKLLLGGADPHLNGYPVQKITGVGPNRLPPWVEDPLHKPYIPFTNQALISLNQTRWLFYELPYLFMVISVSGIFLLLLKTRRKNN